MNKPNDNFWKTCFIIVWIWVIATLLIFWLYDFVELKNRVKVLEEINCKISLEERYEKTK